LNFLDLIHHDYEAGRRECMFLAPQQYSIM
jgi:hypothetical protein